MKAITLLALLTSISSYTIIPATNALVTSTWSVSNAPSTGLTDVTFPLTIVETAHESGYYFSQVFTFIDTNDVGYTGLQPRPDYTDNNKTQSRLHAVFSSFVYGTTTTDKDYCSPGADCNPEVDEGCGGVSCSVDFDGFYNRTYDLEVAQCTPSSRTWIGTVIDTVTRTRIHIGSYTLPEGSGNILDHQVGFVEWFPWNNEVPPNHCAKLPYQKTIFGVPKTSVGVGVQDLAQEDEDCHGEGDVAFHTQRTTGGDMECECGFQNIV